MLPFKPQQDTPSLGQERLNVAIACDGARFNSPKEWSFAPLGRGEAPPYTFATQSLGLTTIVNARDLGGYRLPSGQRIRRGMLLRGGSLAAASDAELQRLSHEFRVARIFDFRTAGEVHHAPDRPVAGATNIWMPAFDEKTMEMNNLALPHEAYSDLFHWLPLHAAQPDVQHVARHMYTAMVDNEFSQVQYAGFLQNIVATTDGAVYWHCSQGKDRTGLGAAFLLAALGADRDLILADYLISNEYYRHDVETVSAQVATEAERQVILTFLGVNVTCFTLALDLIDSRYGGMDAFLRGPLCLDDNDIAALRTRYLI